MAVLDKRDVNDVEKILNHMFHSKYIFFRPSTIAHHAHLKEKHVEKIIKSMTETDVIKRVSIGDKDCYFLTPTTTWILTNLLYWRR